MSSPMQNTLYSDMFWWVLSPVIIDSRVVEAMYTTTYKAVLLEMLAVSFEAPVENIKHKIIH